MIIKVGNLGNDWYNLYMKVLSLFDGMSCGQLALNRLGIKVDKYYASEIDKYAIQVTQANFPETIQVGDVCNLKAEDYQDIDLILAGSPCQGFSFAGKQLAFDDPRSALFFEFIRLLKEIKPKYFLLENVKMKKEFLEVITDQVSACYPEFQGKDLFGGKIEPILINSALVSAQSRQRYYWTNIPNIEQPEDKGIVLRDILVEDGQTDLVGMNGKKAFKENIQKGTALLARDWKGWNTYGMTGVQTTPKQVGVASDINGHDILKRVYSPDGKSPTLNSMSGGNREPKVVSGGALRARSKDKDGKNIGWKETKPKQMLELRKDEKANAVSTVSKDSIVVSEKTNQINPSKKASGKQPYLQDRVFHKDGKSHALTESFADRTNVGELKLRTKSKTVRSGGRGSYDRHEWDSVDELHWRKLTPLECERLQTVPDNYTKHVSKTQRYRMLGNGWTIDVISHILSNMENQ